MGQFPALDECSCGQVLIDATIVRGVLLPATMKLLGDWNWYLPSWLHWLPKLEPHATPRFEPAPAAA